MVPFAARSHVFADFVDSHDCVAIVIMAGDHSSDFHGHQDISAERFRAPTFYCV
jgi:hypothetical protein